MVGGRLGWIKEGVVVGIATGGRVDPGVRTARVKDHLEGLRLCAKADVDKPLVIGRVVGSLVDDDAKRVVMVLVTLDPAFDLVAEVVDGAVNVEAATMSVLAVVSLAMLFAVLSRARVFAALGTCTRKVTLSELERELGGLPSRLEEARMRRGSVRCEKYGDGIVRDVELLLGESNAAESGGGSEANEYRARLHFWRLWWTGMMVKRVSTL